MENVAPIDQVPQWLTLTPKDACMGDPLCEWTTIPDKRPWIPVIIGVGLFGVGLTVLGFFVGQSLNNVAGDMLRFDDPANLGITIAGTLLYAPMVWICYTWHPRATVQIIKRLGDEYFLGNIIPDVVAGRRERIIRDLARPLLPTETKRRVLIGCLILELVIFGTWANVRAWAPNPCLNNPYCFGKSTTFLVQNTFFYDWIWTPVLALEIVMLVSIGMRQAYIAAAFSWLFRTRVVKPKPFDPDGCCGLAFVGDYVLKSAWIPISVWAWLLFLVLYPSWLGYGAWINGVSIFYLIGYLLFPILFFLPAWSLYKAMENVRNTELRPLAEGLREQIRDAATQGQQASERLLQDLEYYAKLEQAYQTIPFRRRGSLVFAVVYLIPVFSLLWQALSG